MNHLRWTEVVVSHCRWSIVIFVYFHVLNNTPRIIPSVHFYVDSEAEEGELSKSGVVDRGAEGGF